MNRLKKFNMSEKKDATRTITRFEALLLFTVLTGAVSTALLSIGAFNALLAPLAGIFLAFIILRAFRIRSTGDNRLDIIFFIILLIAILFRAVPYLYVIGGQDEGIYVSISASYGRSGSAFIKDSVREGIKDEGIKRYYDLNNQMSLRVTKKGEREGDHLPGIYIKDLKNSEYVYQFYPLHPLWMAIFGKILGGDRGVYSLLFFSLLSITALYLLCLELAGGGKRWAARLAAFFVAINPLHAFFSKFPVTEVAALAFGSAGFYLLARFYNNAVKRKEGGGNAQGNLYLFISAGLFGSLFLTRINGFMYLPFFYTLLLAAILFAKDKRVCRGLTVYTLAVMGLYAISVLYGLKYSYPYSSDIYQMSFAKFLGRDWAHWLLLLSIPFAGILAAAALFNNNPTGRAMKKLFIAAADRIHYGVYAVIALGAFRAYQLGFTGRFAHSIWEERWHLTGLGWQSLKYSNLYVAILYVTPLLFLLFFMAIWHAGRQKDPLKKFLLLFLIIFWAVSTVLKPVNPYQYYYARYLLSEVVPYSILLVSLFLPALIVNSRRALVIGMTAILLTSSYSVYYTVRQPSGRKVNATNMALKTIKNKMDGDRLLLFYKKGFRRLRVQILTALSGYYGLPVFVFSDLKRIEEITRELSPEYSGFLVVSQKRLDDPTLSPAGDITYDQFDPEFFQDIISFLPPSIPAFDGMRLYLYRVGAEKT